MRPLGKFLLRFLQGEDGPTAVEYAIMLALIVTVCLIAIITLGQVTNTAFNEPSLTNALTGGS